MRKKKVARISLAVLKWLIPAQKGRFCKQRTGRNLDLLRRAGYRAREMLEPTIRTNSAHDPKQLTETVCDGSDAYGFPDRMYSSLHDLMIPKP
jgi:hypothetical protein